MTGQAVPTGTTVRPPARRGVDVVWLGLIVWGALWTGTHLARRPYSWHYFELGVTALLPGSRSFAGLHLYHLHPELQIGPVSFVVAAPFALLRSRVGAASAAVFMSAVAIVVVGAVLALLPRTERWRAWIPAALLAPAWTALAAGAGHLDDVLATALTTAALVAVRRDRAVLAGVLLALAVDAKPWALPFVVIVLALPRHKRLLAAAMWCLVVAIAWLPFVLADAHTLFAASFHLHNSASSALRALGFHNATTPSWCRAVQLVGGTGIALLLWRLRRPAAIPFGVVAWRLVFDPATWVYYSGGLLAFALVLDVGMRTPRRWAVPAFTVVTFAFVYLPGVVHLGPLAGPDVRGFARLLGLTVAVGLACMVPMADILRRTDAVSDSPGRPRAVQVGRSSGLLGRRR